MTSSRSITTQFGRGSGNKDPMKTMMTTTTASWFLISFRTADALALNTCPSQQTHQQTSSGQSVPEDIAACEGTKAAGLPCEQISDGGGSKGRR